jgi:GT2 family glycosyltransferase
LAAHDAPQSVQALGRSGFFVRPNGTGPAALPTITLSVVTFNSESWIDAWFDSLLKQTYPLQSLTLVFRDHSSNSFTVEALQARLDRDGDKFRQTRVYQAQNAGFGAGHDDIIRTSQDSYVLVANIDLEFEPECIETLVRSAEADPDPTASWEARQAPFEHPKFYDPYTRETAWCSHACVLLDRAKVLSVGSYDRSIFMYGEDVDLSLRLRARGYRLRYVPAAVVVHHTYAAANESKPLQVKGSVAASTKLKLKFATVHELIRHASELRALKRNPDAAVSQAATASWRLMLRDLWRWPIDRLRFFRVQFFGFDYELVRMGAFHASDTRRTPSIRSTAPLVSIIVRTHGDRLDLARGAVASILNQTYRPIEILLCEDGGEAIGAAIGSDLTDQDGVTFRPLGLKQGGRSKAANAGLRRARGDFICFLDDDDALFADHLETLVAALTKHPRVGAAYGRCFEVDFERRDGELFDVKYRVPEREANIYSQDTLMTFNLFPIQSVLFRRILLSKTGLLHEDLDMLEDWNFWCRMSVFTDFLAVNKTTSLYRVPGDEQERLRRTKALNEAYSAVRLTNLAFRDDQMRKLAS